ncbi:MAG TPA: tetratricopeptide repeat-containing protein [Tepidisphaeraceae bacterium]|jgi:class 3 adenylate cyclase/tetratricopeptide (TPR) repeat protein
MSITEGDSQTLAAEADRLLKSGEPLVAYDMLAGGLRQFPKDIRLRQLMALALARSGATMRARAMLEQLRAEDCGDVETLGMLARTLKDLTRGEADASKRLALLEMAHGAYADAYRQCGESWVGINAATTALLLGRRDFAREIARRVADTCSEKLKSSVDSDRYWLMATLGEAALVQGEWARAQDLYRQAADLGKRRWADLAATRRNARLIVEHLNADWSTVDRWFNLPRVAVLVGHMIDRPDRASPRFPAQCEPAVAREIERRLQENNVSVGYSSAACGADILFLEAVRQRGGETHIVLPYPADDFVSDSVDIRPDGDWASRFRNVIESAASVETSTNSRLIEGGVAYEFAAHLLYGMATIRARQLDTPLIPMAVWDRKPGDGPGGTAAVVEHWIAQGHHVEIIEPLSQPELAQQITISSNAVATPQSPRATVEMRTQICGMLFADGVGFSRLTESQLPRFVEHFLGLVGRLLKEFPHQPLMRNTWGDGLFCVFGGVRETGLFALELAAQISGGNWARFGLPAGLNCRMALHAGPAYSCIDPITGARNFIGSHVSQTARIEPITPPGQVYASQSFAALAAAEGVTEFTCEYVGKTPLAKGYGTIPIYHVRGADRT